MVKRFFKERLGTIIFLVILAAFIVAGAVSINKAKENAITYSDEYEPPEKNANLLADGEYKKIAETSSLELYYCEEKGAIQIKNLANGYVWKSIADSETYALNKINKQWAARLQSAISIKYNDLKKRDSGVTQLFCAKDCTYLETNYINNGVAVTYGFITPGIFVTVEYTLDGDNLVVRVPWEKIDERSKYALTTVEVLPFLGTCGNDGDGYLFYPDGSGAVTTFAKVSERPSSVKFATFYTYTNKTVALQNMSLSTDAYNRYTATMPVCGLKNDDNAFVAYATEGKENVAVTVYPSGIVVDLNHIGFEVYTRNVFNVDMYNISTGTDTAVTGGTVQRVDKKPMQETKEIRYVFLTGDQANYSGMAQVYRNYLVDTKQLVKSETMGNGYPLSLRLLMGTTKAGMVFDEYVKMTTFDQVVEILEGLKASGVEDTNVVLQAWMKNYDDYETWGPAAGLGGKSGLKDVSEYASKNSDVNVYVETGMSFANSNTKGFDADDDVAYDGLSVEVNQKFFSGNTLYLMNPYASMMRNNKFLKKLQKYSGLGVAYEDVGRYVYPDYNEHHPYTKAETVGQMKELLKSTADAGHKVAIDGANQYVMSQADFLYNLREKSFGLSITDYAVPFLQMVVSGMIPYSSEDAGNLTYDLQTQKLQWAEFGSMPYFHLTAESALNLRDTGHDTLFSSTYADWEPVMLDTYNEFKQNFGSLYDKQIVGHEILSNDLRKTVYENGVTVYVNYGVTDANVEGITVPAKSYIVAGGNK